MLLEAENLTSRCSTAFHLRSLRPVSAKIVSYGREYQSRRRPTLYVLRVSRSGTADWYVAKRYSEFRALHRALRRQCSGSGSEQHPTCSACEELESFYNRVRFPNRHMIQSGLSFSKERLEAARMEELDNYMRFLLETTQGLLGDEEDDDKLSGWEGADGSQCLALDLIRHFLMVNKEHTTDVHLGDTKDKMTAMKAASATTMSKCRHRHSKRRVSITSLRACELDLVPIGNLSAGDPKRNLFAESHWDSTFADLFDERTTPPVDAFIHRHVEDASARTRL